MRSLLRRRRSGQDRLIAALVLTGLGVFFALTYVVVVLGGGLLIGQTDSPSGVLSVIATVIVALAANPVAEWLEVRVTRWMNGGRQSPYEALRSFAATWDDAHDVPEEQIARVLVESTGADWAQVWLLVNDEPSLAAVHPSDAGPADGRLDRTGATGVHEAPVSHAGVRLGVLRLKEREDQPLTPIEERLIAGLADQAGLVLHGVQLRAELSNRLLDLSHRAEELKVSRQRLVDAHDDERRRLERDIHDGAQQHLVALTVNLRLAQTLAATAPDRAGAVYADQVAATDDAIATLTNLTRGIYPAELTELGVGAAIESAVANAPLPIEVHDELPGRLPAQIEAAVYFCCLEALQNVAKHAGASRAAVSLRLTDGRLEFEIGDDGKGFRPASTSIGSGMSNMRDRVDAVDGTLRVRSIPEGGTRVVGSVPLPGGVPS